MSKRVLIIVHDFPPKGGGAVMRVVKFAKYLPEFGWEATILTRRAEYEPAAPQDPSLLAELPPGLVVHRTRSLAQRAPSRDRWIDGHATARRWLRWQYSRFLVFQDWGYRWLPYALPAVRRILASTRIDAILTTSPPHAVHLLGLWARRVSACPWIADFRDGWTQDPLFRAASEPRNRLERRLQRLVIRRADLVVSVTDTIDGWFRLNHGTERADKFVVISNGFDPADWLRATEMRPAPRAGQPLRIVYAGSLGHGRDARPFLHAVAEIARDEGAAARIEVDLIGPLRDDLLRLASTIPGLTLHPHEAHAQVVERMQSADVLLLLGSPKAVDAPSGKLFEYMAARRPILALTYPGAVSRLIESERLGWAVAPDDVEGIKRALRDIRVRWTAGELDHICASAPLLERFDRRRLTGVLAGMLTRACEEWHPGPAQRPTSGSKPPGS